MLFSKVFKVFSNGELIGALNAERAKDVLASLGFTDSNSKFEAKNQFYAKVKNYSPKLEVMYAGKREANATVGGYYFASNNKEIQRFRNFKRFMRDGFIEELE